MTKGRSFRVLAGVAVSLSLLVAASDKLVSRLSATPPPEVHVDRAPVETRGDTQLLGVHGATRVREGVREVFLDGTPEEIGAAHSALLGDRVVADEAELFGAFEQFVPSKFLRTLIVSIGRLRYRNVADGIPSPRRRELAAEALGLVTDPLRSFIPTYERLVFLHSLYDISLSFEHSPMLGCSSFGFGPGMTTDGHTLFARAFDFEAGPVFDRDKAVYFVRQPGAIPFASVAWPGLVGAFSGMNLEGVAVVLHGGRAGEISTRGEPLVFALREVLERAHTTNEAWEILRAQTIMVSHIVFLADASGHFAVVERAPGREPFFRDSWPTETAAVTNHFEGPLSLDAKNQTVRATTTTLARRARLDELLSHVEPKSADVARAVATLRDHACAQQVPCELGDRRTIDALIATHGIVADTTARSLWVSRGPHLSGAFVRYNLREVFSGGPRDWSDTPKETVPEDPILGDSASYQAGVRRAGSPKIGGDSR